MKRLILLTAITLLFSSCGISKLPPQPPKTVTQPQVISTYQQAVAGDVSALRQIADCYRAGKNGFPRDPDKVLSCQKKMAELGDMQAQSDLGWAYLHGIQVSQNDSQASRWLSLAAAKGDARSQRGLQQLRIKQYNAGVVKNHVNSINQLGDEEAGKILTAPSPTPVYVVTPY